MASISYDGQSNLWYVPYTGTSGLGDTLGPRSDWSARCQYTVTGWGIALSISSVLCEAAHNLSRLAQGSVLEPAWFGYSRLVPTSHTLRSNPISCIQWQINQWCKLSQLILNCEWRSCSNDLNKFSNTFLYRISIEKGIRKYFMQLHCMI